MAGCSSLLAVSEFEWTAGFRSGADAELKSDGFPLSVLGEMARVGASLCVVSVNAKETVFSLAVAVRLRVESLAVLHLQ